MPYTTTIQIEPSTKGQSEAKRQSLYTCIRYASKLMKFGIDIRKHRTLPDKKRNNMVVESTPFQTYNEKKDNYYDYNEEETVVTLYDEKCEVIPTNNSYYSNRVDNQLALPSRLRYVVSSKPIDAVHHLNNNEDEEEYEENGQKEDISHHHRLTNYGLRESVDYTSTLQKLSGVSFTSANNQQSTAVLITLSPCALAAANAARQRRQKIRVNV